MSGISAIASTAYRPSVYPAPKVSAPAPISSGSQQSGGAQLLALLTQGLGGNLDIKA